METVESCEGVRCRPARSSADVCQRGAVHQRMGGGNTPSGVSPHPQGARLCRGSPRSERSTAGSGRTQGKQISLPELPRIDSRSAGSSRDGVATLRGM